MKQIKSFVKYRKHMRCWLMVSRASLNVKRFSTTIERHIRSSQQLNLHFFSQCEIEIKFCFSILPYRKKNTHKHTRCVLYTNVKLTQFLLEISRRASNETWNLRWRKKCRSIWINSARLNTIISFPNLQSVVFEQSRFFIIAIRQFALQRLHKFE